ncbi:MAG: hypothetical protein GDA40_00100 [Rhodobacteraceae bacterium]|nr:hypothetical protein [Paracoccaceae bacterium]
MTAAPALQPQKCAPMVSRSLVAELRPNSWSSAQQPAPAALPSQRRLGAASGLCSRYLPALAHQEQNRQAPAGRLRQ